MPKKHYLRKDQFKLFFWPNFAALLWPFGDVQKDRKKAPVGLNLVQMHLCGPTYYFWAQKNLLDSVPSKGCSFGMESANNASGCPVCPAVLN